MRLPFSEAQFLDVFAAYNAALWPFVVVLWLATAAILVLLLARHPRASRLVAGLLALHWAWAAVAYHLVYFTRINPAAWLFGSLFLLQSGLLLWTGVARPKLTFGVERTWQHALGGVLVAYSLFYPLLVAATGHDYPRMPTFGVPCPTTLLTAGLLLIVTPPLPRWITIMPILWCVIGGSASFVLGMRTDLMLAAAGLLLLLYGSGPSIPGRAQAA
jgi:hypothetical protein